MIHLTEKPPDGVFALGFFWRVQTDFRYWLTYPDRIQALRDGDPAGFEELFPEDVPPVTQETLEALNAFFYTPPEIPRGTGGENVLSYEYDADYIFAGFWQAYGIDLTTAELHWHKFHALLSALPEDTMMSKIIGYRTYKGSKKNNPMHDEYTRLKAAWELPTKYTDEEKQKIDKFEQLFGGGGAENG